MNSFLKNHKGSVLFYALIILFIVCIYVSNSTQQYLYYLQAQHHIQQINQRLALKFDIARCLNQFDLSLEYDHCETNTQIIHIEKVADILSVSSLETSAHYHIYDIISDDSFKWRQIE